MNIHIPTLLIEPHIEWEKILRESEAHLDAELRTDDREYLVAMLSSDTCNHFEPSEAIEHATLMVEVEDVVPEITKVPEMEFARWSNVAHQLFVTVGWFPDFVIEKERHTGALSDCITLSRKAFGQLSTIGDEKKKQSLFRRFRDDYMGYIDLLLCAHEVVGNRSLAPKVLRRLALCGSEYAFTRLPRTPH